MSALQDFSLPIDAYRGLSTPTIRDLGKCNWLRKQRLTSRKGLQARFPYSNSFTILLQR
jgi:hypothetical protein